MSLRVSDWQLESDLDNIRNSCDVFSLNLSLSFLYFIWISSLFQIQGLLIVDFLSPCPSMVAKSVKVFSTCSAKTQCLRFCFCISTHLYFIICGSRGEYLWADSLPAGHDPESLRPHQLWISPPPPYLHLPQPLLGRDVHVHQIDISTYPLHYPAEISTHTSTFPHHFSVFKRQISPTHHFSTYPNTTR